MSEISKFQEYSKKLQGICDENDLVYRFRKDTYPVTLTIAPSGGVSEQLSLLSDEKSHSVFIFVDDEQESRLAKIAKERRKLTGKNVRRMICSKTCSLPAAWR